MLHGALQNMVPEEQKSWEMTCTCFLSPSYIKHPEAAAQGPN